MRSGVSRTVSMWVLATALAGGLTSCADEPESAADPGSSATTASATTPSADSSSPSSDASSSASPTSSPAPTGPRCAAVWTDGATLPASYQGCVAGGLYVARDVLGCSSGQRIVRYDDHFYAVLRGRIYRTEAVLDKDRGYRESVAICRG